jgi:hypothetical protein
MRTACNQSVDVLTLLANVAAAAAAGDEASHMKAARIHATSCISEPLETSWNLEHW